MRDIPSISTGSRVALPTCARAIVIGCDHGRGDTSVEAKLHVRRDGSTEILSIMEFWAIPILGTIGERPGRK